jgi:hypothetical protein
MVERLTLKKLSEEIETLRGRVLELEQQLEHKLETTLEMALARFESGIKQRNLPEHGASIDTEHRQRLIEQEAYLIAEQRGFQGGDPAQDWATAEKHVNHRLMQKDTPGKPALRTKSPARKKTTTKQSSLVK